MDLQVRKIHFVQEFLRLNNEQIIDKLEVILKSEKTKLYAGKLESYSLDEFNHMIDSAEDDSISKRITNVQDLKKDIQTWT